jgi:endonuclease YncB( thermonuclease family)
MIPLTLLAFAGIVTSVHDGDTFRIGDTRVRLAGIDSNETNGTCHNACAPMPALQARDYLAHLVLGKRVTCEPVGRSYKRIVAWCSIEPANYHFRGVPKMVELSCTLVRAGAAVVWQRYDPQQRLRGCR